ncbi:hypothetical protein ACHWQZ_G010871 [Mnemiopsis leidyi]
MEQLPDEVKVQILSYLPLLDLCQVALVSRLWNYLAQDHSLWRYLSIKCGTHDATLGRIIEKHPFITHFKYVNNNKITEAGLARVFVQCGPTLSHLFLDACDLLSSDLISAIVEYCVSLSHLDISSNTCVDDVTICQLATCQSLNSLDISNCDRVTDGGLEVLITQRPLRKLLASYLLDVRVRTIENLVAFCSLTLHTLHLDGGNLCDEDVAKIGQITSLRELEIQYCDEITDVGVIALSRLSHLSIIRLYRCFNLTSCSVSEIAMKCSYLNQLVLSDCSEIDDRGLLSVGRHCSYLEKLGLAQSYNHTVTDVGLSAVLLGCGRLTELILKGLKGVRTFISLIPVLQLKKLQYVHLGGCQNVAPSLQETVAALAPWVILYGHYASTVKKSRYVSQCLGNIHAHDDSSLIDVVV